MKIKKISKKVVRFLMLSFIFLTLLSQYSNIDHGIAPCEQSSKNELRVSDTLNYNWTVNLTEIHMINAELAGSKVRSVSDSDHIYLLISYHDRWSFLDSFYVLKISKEGTIIFNKTFTSMDNPKKITDLAISTAAVYLCGQVFDQESGDYIAQLIKLNINTGDIEWTQNSTTTKYATRIKIISNYIYTAGMDSNDLPVVNLVKWDLNGNQIGSYNFTAPPGINQDANILYLEMETDSTSTLYLCFCYYCDDLRGRPWILAMSTNLVIQWGIQMNETNFSNMQIQSFSANSTHLFIYGKALYNETHIPNYLATVNKLDREVNVVYDVESYEALIFNSIVRGESFYQLVPDRISSYWLNGTLQSNYTLDLFDNREPKYMVSINTSLYCIFGIRSPTFMSYYDEKFVISKLSLELEPVSSTVLPPNEAPDSNSNPNPNPNPNPNSEPSLPEIFVGVAIIGSIIGVAGGQLLNSENVKKIKEGIKKRTEKRVDDADLDTTTGTGGSDLQINQQLEQPLDSLSMESELNALQTGAEIGTATAEQQNMIAMLLKYWNMIPKELRDMIEKLASKYSKFVKQETFRRLIAFENISTEFLTANKLLDLQNLEVALEKLSNAETGALKEKFIPIAEEAAKTKLDVQKGKGGK